jgi:hypothetical protein
LSHEESRLPAAGIFLAFAPAESLCCGHSGTGDSGMSEEKKTQERADYGIDAPDVVQRFLAIGTVAIVLNFAAPLLVTLLPVQYAQMLLGTARSLGWMGYSFIATACVMLC